MGLRYHGDGEPEEAKGGLAQRAPRPFGPLLKVLLLTGQRRNEVAGMTRTLTAATIDSRDFLAAKRRAETEVLLPAGPKIAFTGGLDFNDHGAI